MIYLAISIVLVFFLYAISQSFRKSDNELKQLLENSPSPIDVVYTEDDMRILTGGNPESEQALLFIHGAPGGLDAFKNYFLSEKLTTNYMLISIDRYGYGYSHYGEQEPSIETQAKYIEEVFDYFPNKKWTIVGHSFGAPIAAILGKNQPNVDAVLLVGGAMDPSQEKFTFLATVCNTKLLKALSSKSIQMATQEKLTHASELEKIAPLWINYPTKVIAIHGTKDWLVPFENVNYVTHHFPNDKTTVIPLKGKSHFFVFNETQILENIILENE